MYRKKTKFHKQIDWQLDDRKLLSAREKQEEEDECKKIILINAFNYEPKTYIYHVLSSHNYICINLD